MDKHIIKMPDIGEGIAEVEIVEWHVAAGDTVTEDQVLADVMTDKASVEIPSPISGTVIALGGQVGDILAVGSDLITLQPEASGAAPESGGAPAGRVKSTGDITSADSVKPVTDDGSERHTISDSAAGSGNAAGSDQVTDSPTGTGHSSTVLPGRSGKVLASPSVRHRARQLDIDLADVAGNNTDSPVSHRDLDQFLLSHYASNDRISAGGQTAPDAASGIRHQARSAATGRVNDALTTQGDTRIRVVGLRRQIALKMQESKRQIPHFSYVEEVDVTNLEQLRQTLNDELADDNNRLTLLPFIVRAMVMAVRKYPEVNAHYDADAGEIIRFGSVHMGIATQTDHGLMVPVLHDAQTLDLWECASEIRHLTAATRRGKAQRDELTGSTLTLSSLGALGGIAATPIINHPEVAILGVNRIVERVAMHDGLLVSRKLMNLSSSFDHRIIDGMNAAQFVQEVRRLLEAPTLLVMSPAP